MGKITEKPIKPMKETKPSQKIQINKEILKKMYINQGLSVRECAKKLGLPSHGAISWRLKKYGIKARPARFQKGNTLNKIKKGKESPFYKGGKISNICIDCGKAFKVFPSQSNAYTRCSNCRGKGPWGKDGRHTFVDCAWCDKKKKVKLSQVQNNKTGLFYCDHECYAKWLSENISGEKNPRYKGKIKILCANCGEEKEIFPCFDKEYDKHFCNAKCYGEWQSENIQGEKNPRWIGGREVCGFDAYAEKISFAEDVRRNPDDTNIIQVKCAYCGRWFNPSSQQMAARVRVLYGQKGWKGEARFYCSERCKSACPIYRKILHSEGYSKKARSATSREVQPELRQMRLECDGYICQKCHRTIDEAELHCHHITGVEQNPIESADLDNCITLCKKCHKWAHSQEGCRYFELMCK